MAGIEWRRWAEREGLIHCHRRYQQRQRWTWTHPRFSSEHELDHIFMSASCQWHLQRCRVLFEGPSVTWPWSDYTDHNPVEIRFRHGKLWHSHRRKHRGEDKPDVRKLRGNTEDAINLRRTWQHRVEEALHAFRTHSPDTTPADQWDAICRICRDRAVQVCGLLEQTHAQPWLQGRDQDIQLLDQLIRHARIEDKRVRDNLEGLSPEVLGPLKQRKRRLLNEAKENKRMMFTQWETEWLDQKAEQADQAATHGHMGTVFQIIRELSQAKEHRRRFGLRRQDNPTEEAEAWKVHFESIQSGVGQVPDAVWADVQPQQNNSLDLDQPPTWEEFLRATRDMHCGKAPGTDLFMTEYLKFAGDTLRTEFFAVVCALWRSASSAAPGKEADEWPSKWKEGIIFPLWKRKGDRHDKNTWRGITLLSVGSKLVARICSARLQRWSAPWLNPFQFGFRKGSGVDDVQQVTRSILEEAAGSIHDKTVWLRFYDLEKAYPKVSRPALWKLLALKGCPAKFLGVLHALHDHTASSVRFEGALSTAFIPERGLREGCPSSPVLFNIYHSGIMEVFRARRLRAAQVNNWVPGLEWTFKVDGKLGKRRMDRLADSERNVKHMLIGDIAYADDTAIVGEADEARTAEGIFANTITDFAGKINMAKTEGLRITANPSSNTDVPFLGEQPVVKHVGALLHNRGSHANETNARLNKTTQKLGWVSSAWFQGRGTHRNKRRVSLSVRIKVMKTVVKGVLGSFSKTRAWQTHHLDRAQKVINTAIRRCLNVRLGMLQSQGLSNRILTNLAQWESFESTVRRATLIWAGHVARMSVSHPQKAVMYGWMTGALPKPHAPSRQAQWVNNCLRLAGIPQSDWFRLAQSRSHWRTLVYSKFPPEKVDREGEQQLNTWRPGRPVPAFCTNSPHPEPPHPPAAQGSDEEAGDIRRGRPQHQARRRYHEAPRPDAETGQRQQRAHRNAAGEWECPVCSTIFDKANQLTFHYESEHAVHDPNLVTVLVFTCPDCHVSFRRRRQLDNHTCPARNKLLRLDQIDDLHQVGGVSREADLAGTAGIYLFTDGSGGTNGTAGWGVGIFSEPAPVMGTNWIAALYGPVLTLSCDPLYLGATCHTNNTAELTAIGEACRWLLDFLRGPTPNKPQKAIILYDSEYAYGLATRLTTPNTNHQLAESVATLVSSVRQQMSLSFEHVRGHTGIFGNEVADRLADRGSLGRISPHSTAWSQLPSGPMGGGAARAKPKPAPKPRVLQRPCPDNLPSDSAAAGATPGMVVCDKCSEEFTKGNLNQHHPMCRGPDPANRTCKYCNQVYWAVSWLEKITSATRIRKQLWPMDS